MQINALSMSSKEGLILYAPWGGAFTSWGDTCLCPVRIY